MDDLEEAASDGPPTNRRAEAQPAERAIRRVALIGTGHASFLGPVGASLALAWKAARPALVVTGLDAPDALDAAAEAGAVDHKAASLEAAADGADLVVLAGRLPAALRQLESLAPHLAPGTLVTDTGAVKQPIARQADAVLPEDVSFVGGHPVPASSGSAAGMPDARHLEGGMYVLCPTGEDAPSLERLRAAHPDFLALVEATGARVDATTAARHDHLCAVGRDLPALLATALSDLAAEEDGEKLQALAAPSFRALLEPAPPPEGFARPTLTNEQREALVGNEGAVLDALGAYTRALQQVRRRLAAGEFEAPRG